MILIDDSLFVAEGDKKKCYHHPDDPSLVIKVLKVKSGRYKRHIKCIENEIKVLKEVSRIDGLNDFFPKYYATVITNLGPGYVFEKVENCFDLIRSEYKISRSSYKKIIAILRLMIKHHVPSVADLMRNLFVTDCGEKLYFVEGLGCQYYIPVTMKPFPLFIRNIYISKIMKKYHIKYLKKLRSKVS